MPITTIVFDLDGVILDSEEVWHEVRRDFTAAHGGVWTEDDQRAVMGDNSWQWAHHIRVSCGVEMGERRIIDGVVARIIERYEEHLPLIEGAHGAVVGLARAYRLGLASSAPPEVIRFVLHKAGFAGVFSAWLSTDDVAAGKPAPDGYLAVCSRLGAERAQAAAVEDSENGLIAARNAGLAVVAVPNLRFPPTPTTLELADLVVTSVADLTPAALASLGRQ
ncbi:MAG: HAD family hydrolase [Thermoleophilia bacterium]